MSFRLPTPDESAKRLGVFAALVAALSLLGVLINAGVWITTDELPNPIPRLACGLCLALLSLGVVALWRGGVARARLTAVGLVYSALGALFLAVPEYLGEYFLDHELQRLVWLPLWIAALPLVVAAHPLKHLGVGLVGAVAPALLYWTWLSSEDMFGATPATLAKEFSPLVAALLISLGSATFGRRSAEAPPQGA